MPSNVKTDMPNTQDANADAMKTTKKAGTTEGAMRKRLSEMLTGKRYLMDYSSLFTEDEFFTYIKNSLAVNGPVVLLIEPWKLSYYPSKKEYAEICGGETSNHYIVVDECVEYVGGSLIRIKDPNNLNDGVYYGSHELSVSELYKSSIALLWIV